jgi:hypothetical protein
VDYTTGKLFMPEAHGLTLDDFKLILLYNAAKSGNATLRCQAKFNLESLKVRSKSEDPTGRDFGWKTGARSGWTSAAPPKHL